MQYLDNVLEQDHRAINRRVRASRHTLLPERSGTIAGYESIHPQARRAENARAVRANLLHPIIVSMLGIEV